MDTSPLIFKWRGWVMPLLAGGLLWISFKHPTSLNLWGLLFAAIALICRWMAASHIHSDTNANSMNASALATKGVYALCRHPMYVSNLIAALGWLILLNHSLYMTAAVIIALFLYYNTLSKLEESYLAGIYPQEFSNYRKKTGRWFPKKIKMNPISWRPIKKPRQIWAHQQKNFLWLALAYLLIPLLKFSAHVF